MKRAHGWNLLRHLLGPLFALVFCFSSAPQARAQAAADVPESGETRGALPPAPEGFVREHDGEVVWEVHRQAREVAHELRATYREAWPRLVRELGASVDDALLIRIGRDPEEMAALAPTGEPPPGYASGVAYPSRGLVLLTLAAPETWERPAMDEVLTHELSHIALARAVDGHPIPRWFSEGVAIHQAGEHNLERIRTLWSGSVSGRLLPMDELSGAFPSRPGRVNLAYAESADFVRWLLARDDGEARFREVVRRLGDGQSFETALRRTYSIRMQSLEIEWHDDLSERFQAWPLLFGSGGLWVIAAILIVIAYVRRKRRDRATLRQWEEEERAILAAAEVMQARAVPAVPDDEVVPDEDLDAERAILYVIPPEPHQRDSGVPTIEHDGRSHTLH